jgi:hypothetical protein
MVKWRVALLISGILKFGGKAGEWLVSCPGRFNQGEMNGSLGGPHSFHDVSL